VICVRISTKGARKTLSTLVGTSQSTLGVLAVVFGYFLYRNLFGLQESFQVPAEVLPFYMLILTVFGFFSIISGLFLLTESSVSP
jgi:hypothetical protein